MVAATPTSPRSSSVRPHPHRTLDPRWRFASAVCLLVRSPSLPLLLSTRDAGFEAIIRPRFVVDDAEFPNSCFLGGAGLRGLSPSGVSLPGFARACCLLRNMLSQL
jgi:hypothetical protein